MILTGGWKNGLVATKSKNPKRHLQKTLLDDRISDETHIPFNSKRITQIFRTSFKKTEFLIEVEPTANMMHHSAKAEQDKLLKQKFK